jgi:hypothetical protein
MNPREKSFLLTALVIAAGFIGLGFAQAGARIEKIMSTPAQFSNPWVTGSEQSLSRCVWDFETQELADAFLRYQETGAAPAFCEQYY